MALSDAERLRYLQLKKKRALAQSAPQEQAETSFLDDVGTAVRNFTQGGTFGFSDEIAGAAEAAGRAIGLKGLGTGDRDKFINLPEFTTPTWDADELGQAYDEAKQNELKDLAKDSVESPYLSTGSNVAGAIMSPLSRIGNAKTLGGAIESGLRQGAIMGMGATDGSFEDVLKGTAAGAGIGAAGGGVGYGIGKGIEYGAGKAAPLIDDVGARLKSKAEELAVKATGATGKQTEKFADDAGRQLLDRGLVKFGDSAENIAGRVGAQMDEAGNNISKALSTLDERGITASNENVIKQIEAKIAELSGDPSQASLVRKLQSMLDDVYEAGSSNVPISQMEQVKRGYGSKIKNWLDPEAGAANKEFYRANMDEVERAARDASDKMSGLFEESKKTYGLLAPIEEAASKRAATLNQSPFGGLGDIAATAAGGGNPLYAAGRRAVAPRLASSASVSMDKIGDLVQRAPQIFGKYAKVLQDAAKRGPQGVASTHFLLQSTDPNYRQMLMNVVDKE